MRDLIISALLLCAWGFVYCYENPSLQATLIVTGALVSIGMRSMRSDHPPSPRRFSTRNSLPAGLALA